MALFPDVKYLLEKEKKKKRRVKKKPLWDVIPSAGVQETAKANRRGGCRAEQGGHCGLTQPRLGWEGSVQPRWGMVSRGMVEGNSYWAQRCGGDGAHIRPSHGGFLPLSVLCSLSKVEEPL